MTRAIVRLRIAHFGKWKRNYDEHRASRRKAGLRELWVLRNISNPKEVVVMFQVADLRKARQAFASPALGEAMHKAGVIGKPEVVYLR